MCRLLGWSGIGARTAGDAVGALGLAAFTRLGVEHPDGWGVAWRLDGGAGIDVTHSTSSAATDPRFAEVTSRVASEAAIVHLRHATPGLPVEMANCHPFLRGELAMAHNGSIYPLERLGEVLPAEWETTVVGTTDSERYVLAVVAAPEGGGSLADAVTAVVARLFRDFAPSSLNAVCLSPSELVAVCAYDPNVTVGDVSADDYYRLWWRQGPDGVAVASSGIEATGEGWEPMANMNLLVAARAQSEAEVRPLPLGAPAGAARSGSDLR